MRVLVTGAVGFLGAHVCKRLVAEGHEVVGIDNLVTGRRENVTDLLETGGFTLLERDVSRYLDVDGPVDAILHLASPASPPDYLELPIQTLKAGGPGTQNALGVARAKDARFLLASTSEVYGDPLVNPQPETYWGNVNPVGLRGVYDEAKRFAEALAMAYHRVHDIDVKIARIFNSVLGDECLFFFNDDEAHASTGDEYAADLARETIVRKRRITVPSFDPSSGEMSLREATGFLRIPNSGRDCFEVRLRYGRRIRVTGDHSLFVRGPRGLPEARPSREITARDHVAIPARLPVVEKDRPHVSIYEELIRRAGSDEDLWSWCVEGPGLPAMICENRSRIVLWLLRKQRDSKSFAPGRSVSSTIRRWEGLGGGLSCLPLAVHRALALPLPTNATIRRYCGGGRDRLPALIEITDDFLWLLGFHLAEGSITVRGPKTYAAVLSSDQIYLERAREILKGIGLNTGLIPADATRSPALRVNSRLYCWLLSEVLKLGGRSHERRIPPWVLQLPIGRLAHFLEGYRCGDGTHSGSQVGRELAFNTASPRMADDLALLLLRFGIVGSIGRYETTCKGKRFSFSRVTVCELSSFDILSWKDGVRQTLNASRWGDLVWAKVKEVLPCQGTPYFYDLSVPDRENFIAGLVCAHNTYGPLIRPHDGRVVSNFIRQALAGEAITVYGDGSQTRSFCYVDDLVEGLYRLLLSDHTGPMNLGNPAEITVFELAETVLDVTGSDSEIVYEPLPVDDPRVRRPDITLAREVLGWSPVVPLRTGLERTATYFRDLLGVVRG